MILYPKKYINNVLEISVDFLKEKNINGLILDVDNTLLFHDRTMITGLTQWVDNMKKNKRIGEYFNEKHKNQIHFNFIHNFYRSSI